MVSTIVTFTPTIMRQLLIKDHHMASQIVILYLHQRPLLTATTLSLIKKQKVKLDLLIPFIANSFRVFTPAISTPITSVMTLESSLENRDQQIKNLISPSICQNRPMWSQMLMTQISTEEEKVHTSPTSQNGEFLTSTHSLENENIS